MFHVLLLVVCLSGMTVGHSNFLDLLKKARVAAKEYYGNYWDSIPVIQAIMRLD
jgi:hypothetical protein